MGDPLTAVTAAGLGVDLAGGVMRGQADQRNMLARAAAARQNQSLAEQQAADALSRGALAAGQLRMRGSQVIGQQRAAFGASGVDANVGSAAQAQAAVRGASELDASTALNNARRQAWGYQVTADQYGQQESIDRRAAGEVGIGTDLGVGGQLLGGISRFLSADRPGAT